MTTRGFAHHRRSLNGMHTQLRKEGPDGALTWWQVFFLIGGWSHRIGAESWLETYFWHCAWECATKYLLVRQLFHEVCTVQNNVMYSVHSGCTVQYVQCVLYVQFVQCVHWECAELYAVCTLQCRVRWQDGGRKVSGCCSQQSAADRLEGDLTLAARVGHTSTWICLQEVIPLQTDRLEGDLTLAERVGHTSTWICLQEVIHLQTERLHLQGDDLGCAGHLNLNITGSFSWIVLKFHKWMNSFGKEKTTLNFCGKGSDNTDNTDTMCTTSENEI